MARLPAAERRRALLASALRVFAAEGFHGASMQEVAAGAGVTKPVLYQHFASKHELYRALLGDLGEQLREKVAKAAADAGTPRRQVEAGFAAYFAWVGANTEGFGVLFAGETRRDPEFAQELERVERDIAETIAALIVVPGLPADRRRLLAFGIVGIAETTARHWLAGGGDPTATDLSEQVAGLAWAGLRGLRPS